MKRLVILGGGESGVGTAILAKKENFDVFLSDRGLIKEKYKQLLEEHGIVYEEGQHTEELILNADDTSNFLKAIEVVRSISTILDQKATLASLGLLGVTSSGVLDTSSQKLEQEVTIHAEFPNATDRNEIEEAFNSLIGTASQYANRK